MLTMIFVSLSACKSLQEIKLVFSETFPECPKAMLPLTESIGQDCDIAVVDQT